jgi:hypothetical protein
MTNMLNTNKKAFVVSLWTWRNSTKNIDEADQICSLIKSCCVSKTYQLNLWNFYSIEELPLLPKKLTVLNVSGCMALKKIPNELPQNLTSLDVSMCSALKEILDLPKQLIKLDATGCKALVSLPNNFPITLKILILAECSNLSNLPDNMPLLDELKVSWCRELKMLPILPPTLIKLDITGCCLLTRLPELPKGLEKLYISNCYALTELPENLPVYLTNLNLMACCSLRKLPTFLPIGTTYLNLIRCNMLKELPGLLPESLKYEDSKVSITKFNENFFDNGYNTFVLIIIMHQLDLTKKWWWGDTFFVCNQTFALLDSVNLRQQWKYYFSVHNYTKNVRMTIKYALQQNPGMIICHIDPQSFNQTRITTDLGLVEMYDYSGLL